MTGFGKKEAQYEDKHISIEVRSLNSKNADINLRSPSYLRELDPDIRKQLTSKMYRGKSMLMSMWSSMVTKLHPR
jgi:uncharacterized protein YicC (UPF0701 family)